METIIVNGQIFRNKSEALAYCEAKSFRISGTETIYKRGRKTLIWSVTTLPADIPASGYIADQEAAYFDNFCQQNNI